MMSSTGTPNLDGLGERAGEIVEGESAEEYIFYSITEPGRHIAEGFGNAMPNTYDERPHRCTGHRRFNRLFNESLNLHRHSHLQNHDSAIARIANRIRRITR